MKLLVWKFKYDDYHFDISTLTKEAAAYRYMFETLDDFGAYCDLCDEVITEEEKWIEDAEEFVKKHSLDHPNVSMFVTDILSDTIEKIEKRKFQANDSRNQFELYKKAKAGDTKAMRKLLYFRSSKEYEYETFNITETVDIKTAKAMR